MKEVTIGELLQNASPKMKELLLKRAQQHQGEPTCKSKNFEAFISYSGNNYSSRVNATDLIGLERGLQENLQRVQEALSNQWSADSQKTVREVLQDEN